MTLRFHATATDGGRPEITVESRAETLDDVLDDVASFLRACGYDVPLEGLVAWDGPRDDIPAGVLLIDERALKAIDDGLIALDGGDDASAEEALDALHARLSQPDQRDWGRVRAAMRHVAALLERRAAGPANG